MTITSIRDVIADFWRGLTTEEPTIDGLDDPGQEATAKENYLIPEFKVGVDYFKWQDERREEATRRANETPSPKTPCENNTPYQLNPVVNFSEVFRSCSTLTTIDLRGWDLSGAAWRPYVFKKEDTRKYVTDGE